MFDFESFCKDYSIPYRIRKDDILTFNCPFCHSSSGKSAHQYTGGFLFGKTITCFRCGKHSLKETVIALSNCSEFEYKEIFNRYYSNNGLQVRVSDEDFKRPTKLVLNNLKEMDELYADYLKQRGFSPFAVTKKFDLKFTDHVGELASRIIIPIFYQNKLVSFTSRAILSNAKVRYLSCPDRKEVVPHKSILYNIDNCKGKSVAVVEGPFDLIKAGGNDFVATFGTSWKPAQADLLKNYEHVFILFDAGEEEAAKHAKELAKALSLFTKVDIIDTETPYDIGDFSKDEVMELRKFLGFSYDIENIWK